MVDQCKVPESIELGCWRANLNGRGGGRAVEQLKVFQPDSSASRGCAGWQLGGSEWYATGRSGFGGRGCGEGSGPQQAGGEKDAGAQESRSVQVRNSTVGVVHSLIVARSGTSAVLIVWIVQMCRPVAQSADCCAEEWFRANRSVLCSSYQDDLSDSV